MSDSETLRNYYQKQLDDLKSKHKEDQKIRLIESLENQLASIKKELDKSKISTNETIDQTNHLRAKKMMMNLHNSTCDFAEKGINNFINYCREVGGMKEIEDIDFSNYKIKLLNEQ